MGFLKDILGAAAPIVGGIFGGPGGAAIGGLLGNAIGGSGGSQQSGSAQTNQNGTQNGTQTGTQSGTTSNTATNALNPTIGNLLGMNGGGILGSLGGTMNGGSNLSNIGNNFVNSNADQMLHNAYAGTNTLASNQFVQPTIEAAQVYAPSQNKLDLSGSYDRFVNGTPGANPYLDQSINGAIAQNRLGFQQLQDDSTKNLMQNIMPSIRSNSVLAGQYGGSRQGVAEGNAIGTQQTELARAASQFGQNATNAAVGAKAGAYETDSNRALSATQGLGAQQYGVEQQNALARQAADNTNVNALLATRGQNSANSATGISLQQNLLGTAAGYGNADLSRLGATAGILQPFLGAGATTSNNGTSNATNNSTTNNTTTGNVSQPLYSNPLGNALGGATAAMGLVNQFGGGSTDYNAIRNGDGNPFGNLFSGGNANVFNTPASASTYTPPTTMNIPSLPMWGG